MLTNLPPEPLVWYNNDWNCCCCFVAEATNELPAGLNNPPMIVNLDFWINPIGPRSSQYKPVKLCFDPDYSDVVKLHMEQREEAKRNRPSLLSREVILVNWIAVGGNLVLMLTKSMRIP